MAGLAVSPPITWPSWYCLAPSLGSDVLVVGGGLPEGATARWVPVLVAAADRRYAGIVLLDATNSDLECARDLLVPGGWMCAGIRRGVRTPTGVTVLERYVPLPGHQRPVATIPVVRGGSRLLTRTLFLPYARPGRARRARRGAMLALPRVLALVPMRLLATVAPSQLVIARTAP